MNKQRFFAEMIYPKDAFFSGSKNGKVSIETTSHAEAFRVCQGAIVNGYMGNSQLKPTMTKVRTVEHG